MACGPLPALIFYGTAWVAFAGVYMAGYMLPEPETFSSWSEHVWPVIQNAPWICSHVSGLLMLVMLHATLGKTLDGRLTWMCFFYIYIPPVLFPMSFALGPHMCLLYILGVLVKVQPFYGEKVFAYYAGSYWIFVAVGLLLMTMPDLLGRCDLYPPQTVWERFRWDFCEAGFALLLLTKTLTMSDPAGLVGPLSWWSLFAFCSHLALARSLSMPSLAGVIILGTAPLFVVALKLSASQKKRAEQSHTAPLVSKDLGMQPPDAARKPYGTF